MADVIISTRKKLLFSFIAITAALLLAEGTIRIWAYYYRSAYHQYNTALGRYELIPNTRFTTNGREFLINSKGFAGPDFDAEKPRGVYRIFALGDSCTIGYWKYAYPGVLESLLNGNRSGGRFEVINAGIEGYNSEYALRRLKEDVLQYEPDMVIIYIGWNDIMKANPDNLSAVGRYRWIAQLIERSYLIKAYRKFLFFYLRPLIMKPRVIGGEAEAHAFDDFVPLAFQKNLENIIETAREQRILPVLLTLPTVVKAGMNYEALERENVIFPYYAGTYSVDKFLSLHGSYNAAIRKTAEKYKVELVDLDAIFNRFDKGDLFWDTMHPSEKGQRLIAESLNDTIGELAAQEKLSGNYSASPVSVRIR